MKNKKQLEMDIQKKVLCLSLSQAEYTKLAKEAKETGKNVQTLIRDYLKEKKNVKPVMRPDEAKNIVTELKRIGNNVNQIARHLNSGFRRDWHDSFEQCAQDLNELRTMVTKNVAS